MKLFLLLFTTGKLSALQTPVFLELNKFLTDYILEGAPYILEAKSG
jgi:hypothetical protein